MQFPTKFWEAEEGANDFFGVLHCADSSPLRGEGRGIERLHGQWGEEPEDEEEKRGRRRGEAFMFWCVSVCNLVRVYLCLCVPVRRTAQTQVRKSASVSFSGCDAVFRQREAGSQTYSDR